MFQLTSTVVRKPRLSLLCLGAHSDDIEIGCGGTVLHLLRTYDNCDVTWVVLSANGKRRREALSGGARFLKNARRRTLITKGFKESFFPYRGEAIKKFFEQLKRKVSPDLIFTHYRNDLHQDHRMVSELTWNTFRQHAILEYEIPKYDGDIGQPNLYVPLTQALCAEKIRNLMECFSTQRSKHWFLEDTFYSLLQLRGIESHATSKYAEAFYCRKMLLG